MAAALGCCNTPARGSSCRIRHWTQLHQMLPAYLLVLAVASAGHGHAAVVRRWSRPHPAGRVKINRHFINVKNISMPTEHHLHQSEPESVIIGKEMKS